MPITGQGVEIRLPMMTSLPWGLFIDEVPRISIVDAYEGRDRTLLGARFMAQGALSPIIVDFDCEYIEDPEDEKTGNVTLEQREVVAFEFHNLFECSELSGDMSDFAGMLRRTFEATASEALTFLATANTPSAHLNLATDSTALAASTSPTDAIGAVEKGLRDRISNLAGYIFVPPRQLAAAMAAGAVRLMDGRLISPAGHTVISDAGHQGDGTFYGTGAMGYAVTNPEFIGNQGEMGELDRTRNIRRWLVENYGVVAFNPAWSVRTTLSG